MLEYWDYNVRSATKPSEDVLEDIRNKRYKLLILDIMLFREDGRDLAKKIRREINSEQSILMISAYPNVEDSAIEAGADGFIEKPFDIDELKVKVEQFV